MPHSQPPNDDTDHKGSEPGRCGCRNRRYTSCPRRHPEVAWENLGHVIAADGSAECRQRFTVRNAGAPFDRLAFCMPRHDIRALNPADTIVEILPGYYAVGSPRFASPGDSLTVEIAVQEWIHNAYEIPDGMHLVRDAQSVATHNSWSSSTRRREQWLPAGWDGDPMIYGEEAFAVNDSLQSAWRPAAYGQIPTLKSVRLNGKKTPKPILKAVFTDDPRQRYYRVRIEGDTAVVSTNSRAPEAILAELNRRIDESADADGMVPQAELEDWADFGYRGLMIDVARNFTDKEEIKKIISLMARYGLNVLHFHLGDDEGWRSRSRDSPNSPP